MNSLRIRNLRALADTGDVPIRPITILLGANSSGKSTFLRTFPLFRQSAETEISSPLLWYGGLVDFGSFATSKRRGSIDGVSVDFAVPLEAVRRAKFSGLSPLGVRDRYLSSVSSDDQCAVSALVVEDDVGARSSRLTELKLRVFDLEIVVRCDQDERIASVSVDGADLPANVKAQLRLSSGSLFPNLLGVRGSADDKVASGFASVALAQTILQDDAVRACDVLFHGRTSREKVSEHLRRIPLGTRQNMLAQLFSLPNIKKNVRATANRSDGISFDYSRQVNALVLRGLPWLLEDLGRWYRVFARNVQYAKPIRASAERYYRQQDLAVELLDPEGRNLAVFLRSLSAFDLAEFTSWTRAHLGWAVRPHTEGGHISLLIDEGKNNEFNLSDSGFGFSQILPLVAYLWRLQRSDPKALRGVPIVFAIEQPELHLHPRMQAQLAQAFIASAHTARERGVDLRLVVETHSESLVNALGNAVAESRLSVEDVGLLIFEADRESSSSTIHFSGFDNRGALVNWPFGFFEP